MGEWVATSLTLPRIWPCYVVVVGYRPPGGHLETFGWGLHPYPVSDKEKLKFTTPSQNKEIKIVYPRSEENVFIVKFSKPFTDLGFNNGTSQTI